MSLTDVGQFCSERKLFDVFVLQATIPWAPDTFIIQKQLTLSEVIEYKR